MMQVFIPRENDPEETRAALDPGTTKALVDLGAAVTVEAGVGVRAGFVDDLYHGAGAEVTADRAAAFAAADLVLRVGKPPETDLDLLERGAVHISFLDPFNNRGLIEHFCAVGVNAVSLELIPRTTLAQKMDALSSQASLAGYVAVIVAAARLPRVFPMMMTPAGTISPTKVFVIGAGVAGLQAIATAKRLGARVEAFDTRPVAAEQVRSLGARFLEIDLGDTGQTGQGYAKKLTAEQVEKQKKAMAKSCATADVVITTAQVFGRRAPVIVTDEMVAGMVPGSVIVDLAADSGGNVAGTQPGKETEVHGVSVIGFHQMARRVPVHATQMYAGNLANFITHFWDKEAKALTLNTEDEIMKSALAVHEGRISSPVLIDRFENT